MLGMSKATQVPVEEIFKIPLFYGLDQNDMSPLIHAAHEKRLTHGEFFFLQGDPAEYMHILVQGSVKLSQCGPEGKQVLLRVIKPVQLFGLVAITPGNTYLVTAQAARDSATLYWNRNELKNYVSKVPQIALNAMNIMAEQLREIQERYSQATTQRVEQRLARTLIRLSAESGKGVQEGILIDHTLSRQDLAEMSGTTLYTVSRMLRQWHGQQLIIAGRQQVIIRNPHGLMKVIEDSAS